MAQTERKESIKDDFRNHPVFKPPSDHDSPIWRYMDFTKFVSMLQYGGLYFRRVDLLGDPFEGSLPRLSVEARERLFKTLMKGDIDGPVDALAHHHRVMRMTAFANCWHLNDHESAAMWAHYAGTEGAIAIRSTFRALDDSLGDAVFLGMVKYIDYKEEIIGEKDNSLSPLIYKRASFAHEREVRALVWDVPLFKKCFNSDAEPNEVGRYERVDLDRLISRVFVAPRAQPWLRELVEAVTRKHGLAKVVHQSSLDEEPLF